MGFIVDAGLMSALLLLVYEPLLWRIPSFAIACLVTWKLNSIWTFNQVGSLSKYFAVQSLGAGVNYFVFALVIMLIGTQARAVGLAFVLGSLAGLFWNFLLSRKFVFSKYDSQATAKPNKTPGTE